MARSKSSIYSNDLVSLGVRESICDKSPSPIPSPILLYDLGHIVPCGYLIFYNARAWIHLKHLWEKETAITSPASTNNAVLPV
jgi:hypothetical protein